MSIEATEKERVSAKLKEQLSKVPASVSSGSHQNAVAFKKFHESATKMLAGGRASLTALLLVANQAKTFYGP